MSRQAFAVYKVTYIGGWTIDEMAITNDLRARARNGDTRAQDRICIQFRELCQDKYGRKPDYVKYDQLVFDRIRAVPAKTSPLRLHGGPHKTSQRAQRAADQPRLF